MAINSLSASSYGLSGLVSGMNTQELVEKMLGGTQTKIDKATQKKSVLQYKQSMYRDVAAKLRTLQSSFLSFTSKTNLLSSSFYNTMTTKISTAANVSAAFSVSASSSANAGTVTMDYIKQLATARTSKTEAAATGAVSGTLSREAAAKIVAENSGPNSNMAIKVGDTTMYVNDVVAKFGGASASDVVAELNRVFAENGNIAEARFANNKLQIIAADANDSITVSGNTYTRSSLSMQMFGSVYSLSGSGTFEAEINTDNYLPGFDVNLDGRQQTIHMDVAALRTYAEGGSAADLLTKMQDDVQRKFGAGVQLTGSDLAGEATFAFKTGQSTQKMTITGTGTIMETIGLKSGISNKLNTSMSLKDLNFAEDLQGNKHTFKINGVEFSYDSTASLGKIVNDINNSKAGVKISYIESEDRFMIQSAETGAGSSEFKLEQTEGNFLSVMFGVEGGSTVQGYGVNMPMTSGVVNGQDIRDGGTFTFNVNGSDYKFTISRKSGDSVFTHETLAEKLNEAFSETFGTLTNGDNAVEFNSNGDGTFSIVANNKDLVVKATKLETDKNTHQLGFTTGQSTQATGKNFTLSDAGIVFGAASSITIDLGDYGTTTISGASLTGNETMEQMANLINTAIDDHITQAVSLNPSLTAPTVNPSVSFDEKTAAFRLAGVDIPMELVITGDAGSENLDNLFGSMSIAVNSPVRTYNAGTSASPDYQPVLKETDAGQNSVFSINGSEMERASNSFTIDGLTYTLHSTTHTDQSDPASSYRNPAQISITRDTEKIVEGLQEFLKLYNETIDYMNDLYRAEATYKDYAPLTEKQKTEMSDREIELWEAKAQEGLLRSDTTIGNILQSMRNAMYTKPDGSTIAIYDLGISTSFYSNDGNFNAESIDDLRAAIENDPEAVRRLFAGEGGIMEKLNDALNNATRSSYASPGTLVAVAGSSTLDTSSTIYKQIKEVDNQLSTLETRYWNEYNRYWKQFNAMEQYISQMNSQSSWLSQLGG